MAQRLVRAKLKIREAGLRFEEPEAEELPERLHAVLEAVYAAYGLGWDAWSNADSGDGDDTLAQGLRSEALFLADLVCSLLPAGPGRAEAEGLLALILFCEARVPARFGAEGVFVPLAEQDTGLWQRDVIDQGNRLLHAAARWQSPGPFQLEAAIQSAHCQRLVTGATPWQGIVRLYARLLAVAPSLGADVAHAVACAHAGEVARAADLLAALDGPRLAAYQPYWVACGHVAALAGQPDAARQALQRAIGLTSAPALRRHLQQRLSALPA
jgi:RNA polymerase sigma-70 factor (ECF subfamily)